ncbi:MAG: hypothetical protein NTV75_06915 [Bacteroidia bacterium]|nr:hypothetical protein [Bacteroidia bacterium]
MSKILKIKYDKRLIYSKLYAIVALLLISFSTQGSAFQRSLNHAVSTTDISSTIGASFVELTSPSTPPPANPSDVTLCEGLNATFTVSGATLYQWENSPDGTTWTTMGGETLPTLTLFNVTSAQNGIKYRCLEDGAPSSFATLTVNPLPIAAGTINGTATVCQGQSLVTYSIPVITNATSYEWTYSGSGATITNGTTNSISITFASNASAGNLAVRGVNSCGNGTFSANYPIAMNFLPVAAGAIAGSVAACQGQNGVSYSVPSIANATTYDWVYSGTGATISGNSASVTINFSATATSGSLTVTGRNACGVGTVSTTRAITVGLLPGTSGSIAGTATVCQSQSGVTYNVSAISGATTYTWAYSGTGATITGSSNSVTITFAASATSGNLTVKGTNSCGDGVVSADYAITVNPLPVAAGTITGTSGVCQGQTSVAYSVPVITNATSYEWAYTGSGATITNATTNSILITFSSTAAAGNLTVRGVNSCGNGTFSAIFPIGMTNLPAAAGIISGLAAPCQGSNNIAYTVGAISNATSYDWVYSGTGATITGSTTSTSINFSATATNGNLTVTGRNACGVGTVSGNKVITLNQLPVAAGLITGNATVCQGQSTVAYSVPLITSATTYTWAYSGTGATITGNSNNVTITFAANATAGNLTVKGTNTCGDGVVSADYAIAVNPLPVAAGAITGTATVCQGQSLVAYSVPVITNATTYEWTYTGSGITITNGTTNSVLITFASTASSGNLTVRGVSSCGNGTYSANYAININPLPALAGAITGSLTPCQGSNGNAYSVPAIASATTYEWVYSGTGATITGTTLSTSINFSATATNGNLTVTGRNACGVGTVSANKVITLNQLPVAAGLITGNATVCQGQSTVAYSVPIITNATTYTWAYSGTGATITGNSNNVTITFAANATAGNLTVKGSNSCGDGVGSADYAIAVNPLPVAAGIITGAASVCQGQSLVNYSVPVITNATSYEWTYSGSGVTITNGTTNNISITFASNASSGNLTVRGVNSCGNGAFSANFAITLSTLPVDAGTITGSAIACQGQNTVAYTIPAISGANSYDWAYSGTGVTITGSSASPLISFSATATSGNLTVAGRNGCGVGTVSANKAITVSPLPVAAGLITGTATVCQGQATVVYTVPAIGNATSYTWAYSGTGATITGATNSVSITYASNATAGNLTVKGTNACGDGIISANYAITVNPLPVAAGAITGTATVCQGQTLVSYTIPAIANAASYEWTYSGSGITIINGTTNSISITFANNATGGNLAVRGVNGCGNGTFSANYAISMSNLPADAGAILGAAAACQGSNANGFTVPAISGATSYDWAYSGTGATITGATTSTSLAFSSTATSGNLTVAGRNACGVGTVSAVKAITVNPLPIAAGSIAGTATVCQGQSTVTYSVPAITNATTYTWAYSGTGATITGTSTSVTITYASNATSGNLTVKGTNACGDGVISANYPIIVNPLPIAAGTITGTGTVCQGQTLVAYAIPAITNATSYEWTYSGAGVTITNGTTNNISITFASNATAGNLAVRGVNGCGNGTFSANYAISMSTLPADAGIIVGAAAVCQGQNGVSFTVPAMLGATSYDWSYSGTGATITGTTVNPTINFSASATSGNLTVAGRNACGVGTISANKGITINPLPVAPGLITGTATVCQGQTTVAYTVPVITNATTYTWAYSGAGATITGTSNSVTITYAANATSGNLTVKGTNACGDGSVSATYAITVDPLPIAAGTITGTGTVCQGQTLVAYTIPVITNATSYEWTYSGTGVTITNSTTNSISITFASNASAGNLAVRGVNSCGNGTFSANYPISISQLPVAAGIIGGSATACQGQSGVVYTIPDVANATSYDWAYSGTGATITGTSASVTVSFSASATNGNLTVTGRNACGVGTVSANKAITISQLPGAAGLITGSANVCQSQSTLAYTVPVIANATSYTWAYSGTGATITGATNNITITFAANATAGNLTVKGTNTCGDGTISANYAITVNPPPVAAGTITGTANVCQGQTLVGYTIPVILNATSYEWTYSGTGVTITNGATNSISITFANNATAGNLAVRGVNGCGNGAFSANYPITISQLPADAGIIVGSATACQGQTGISYSIPAIAGATSYDWVYSGTGATISGNSATISINFSSLATSGNLTVTGRNACGVGTVSTVKGITVSSLPAAAGLITGTAAVCQGQSSVAYTVPAIASATSYTWAYSGTGATITGTSNSITITYAANATGGNLTVKGINLCGEGTISGDYAIIVNPLPVAAGTITGTSTVCQGQTLVAYTIPVITSATSYEWTYSGTGATITNGTTNSISITFANNATAGNLAVRGVNSCGNGTFSANYPIAITSLPADAGVIAGAASVCQGSTGNAYSVPTIAGATLYDWVYSGTGQQ